jgi:hypothetical protein
VSLREPAWTADVLTWVGVNLSYLVCYLSINMCVCKLLSACRPDEILLITFTCMFGYLRIVIKIIIKIVVPCNAMFSHSIIQ